jgi:hypothetical protein
MKNPLKIAKGIKAATEGKGAEFALNEARSTIVSRIKEGRVKFIDDKQIEYTDKSGTKTTCSFKTMAQIFIDITGQRENLSKLGVSDWDIEMIFRDEYSKQKGGVK